MDRCGKFDVSRRSCRKDRDPISPSMCINKWKICKILWILNMFDGFDLFDQFALFQLLLI